MSDDDFWGLCAREYEALKETFLAGQTFDMRMVNAIRADMHNTAGKSFEQVFKADDFLEGSKTSSLEARIYALIEQGYAPAAAAAMASSTQTREHRLHVVQTTMDEAHRNKTSGKKRRKGGKP